MDCEEFLGIVLAPDVPEQMRQAMLDLLRKAYDQSEALPDPLMRARAHMAHILQANACLQALATPQALERIHASMLRGVATQPPATQRDLDVLMQRSLDTQLLLVQSCGETFKAMVEQVRRQFRHRVARHDYSNESCGAYPLRNARHEPLHVVSAQPLSNESRSGRQYAFAAVEPYTNPSLSDSARAELYLWRLQARTLTAADLKQPDESALIGQRGVFATRAIARGSCLGVYGGQILDDLDSFLVEDDTYIMNFSTDHERLHVNGENMMSLTNTLFTLDENGVPSGHPETGYNTELVTFHARLADGRDIGLQAFFAIADIAPGEELRWNYRLGQHVPT